LPGTIAILAGSVIIRKAVITCSGLFAGTPHNNKRDAIPLFGRSHEEAMKLMVRLQVCMEKRYFPTLTLGNLGKITSAKEV
jgi:hypothetical protein